MLANLEQLHNAIISGLRTKLTGVPTVDAYPAIQRRITLPAVVVELSELEPGTDIGTGEASFIGRFQARAIVDPNGTNADMAVRELAARIAVAIHHQSWAQPVSVARLIQIGEDAFKPELDSYQVWVVEWTHEFQLGEVEWPYEDNTGLEIMIGLYPETGAGNQGDYWKLGSEPPENWGETK